MLHKTSITEIERAYYLRISGMRVKEIAALMDVPISAVYRWLKRAEKDPERYRYAPVQARFEESREGEVAS